ncbi:MAG: PDZ domain-containing protein [Bacteroidota bacterium]|nr:PDZ domain-containing protein [Bacteroidota bacterium]
MKKLICQFPFAGHSLFFLFCCPMLFGFLQLDAQIDAGLFRYPDVSETQIVFSYANDLWLMPKEGGEAFKISSSPGMEIDPKFSPDGKSIAFTGNYDGNKDVYTLPVQGGVPRRVTEHGYPDRVVDWTPDGRSILFASNRESGKARFNQFYTIPASGGSASKLPLAYAEHGSYSPDGKQMAVTFRTQINRNWKRYRGGWKADIYIFNFNTLSSEDISAKEAAGDELPMWSGHYIYFLSDRGTELRMNLWRYDMDKKVFEQLTHFSDYDVHFPSLGPQDIVFEAGGKLYLFQLDKQQIKEVKVSVATDEKSLKPKLISADKYIQHAFISPDGNRVVMEARGDLFSLPAENGFVKDLTQSSGVAERFPSWSPDGKSIAFWSDRSGEYELYLSKADEPNSAKKLAAYGPGYRYNLFWSPDGHKLAFIDKALRIQIYDIVSGQTTEVDKALRYTEENLENFSCSWSPDSRWLIYSRDLKNYHEAVFLYDFRDKSLRQVTTGFYTCSDPVFDPEGKYIYLLTTQSFSPYYSDIDNSFIYANSVKVAAISLKKSTPSVLYPKNDTVSIKSEKEDTAKEKTKNRKGDKTSAAPAGKADIKPVGIDPDGLESRLVILPVSAGSYSDLSVAKGKVLYLKNPNTGSGETQDTLKYYDIEKREEKTIMVNAGDYQLSADRQKILVHRDNAWAVIKPEENQKFEKPLHVSEMKMMVDPAAEWQQIFTDVWRLERDFFYDSTMHGVDWNLVKERYSKMLKGAMTREDVDFIIGEMIGELSSSHTYHGGGDLEKENSTSVGYLGVDWEADGNFYKIKRIIRGASWDAEVRSSLEQPGIRIKEGDYILAVNGVPLTTDHEPYAFFQDLSNKVVELTYNSSASWSGAKTEVVQTLRDEYRLRNLAWIEGNRKRVEEATQGEVGYIYVPSTGFDGQTDLIRQFNAQWDKKGLIIDERFNDGGQIPDRFIEMLNRTPLAFWATRDGLTWPSPPFAHFGPKVMLINGWSGSGGDAFPDYFRKKGLGPLIGARTWGGLIGISGAPALIDGGGVTVPTFRMLNPDGTWFKEGHGVDPDIEVREDLGLMAKGIDPQLERAITEIKDEVQKKSFTAPNPPPFEKR